MVEITPSGETRRIRLPSAITKLPSGPAAIARTALSCACLAGPPSPENAARAQRPRRSRIRPPALTRRTRVLHPRSRSRRRTWPRTLVGASSFALVAFTFSPPVPPPATVVTVPSSATDFTRVPST